MTFGRKRSTRKSILAVNLDGPATDEVLKKLSDMDFMDAVYFLALPTLSGREL